MDGCRDVYAEVWLDKPESQLNRGTTRSCWIPMARHSSFAYCSVLPIISRIDMSLPHVTSRHSGGGCSYGLVGSRNAHRQAKCGPSYGRRRRSASIQPCTLASHFHVLAKDDNVCELSWWYRDLILACPVHRSCKRVTTTGLCSQIYTFSGCHDFRSHRPRGALLISHSCARPDTYFCLTSPVKPISQCCLPSWHSLWPTHYAALALDNADLLSSFPYKCNFISWFTD